MSEILNQLKAVPTGRKSFDRLVRMASSIDLSEVNRPSQYDDTVSRYRMIVQIGTEFSAPSHLFDKACDNARRLVANNAFGDLHKWVYMAEAAIMEGGREAALAALETLEEELKP